MSGQEASCKHRKRRRDRGKRSWLAAIAISVPVLAGVIAVSATVNPLIGRAVHWDWVVVGAPVLLAAMAVAVRRRWV